MTTLSRLLKEPPDVPFEERLRQLDESRHEFTIVVEGGLVTHASASSARVLHYQPESLYGKRFLDLVHTSDRKRLQYHLESSQRGFYGLIEPYRILSAEGEWCFVESVTTSYPGVEGLMLRSRNVTELVQAQERYHHTTYKLEITEELLRRTVESVPSGVINLNSDGHIFFLSEQAKELLGFGPRNFLCELAPRLELLSGTPSTAEELLACQEAVRGLVYAYHSPGGEHKIIELSASPFFVSKETTGVVLTLSDYTDRYETQCLLHEHHALLQDSLDALGVCAAILDEEGRTHICNRAWAAFTERALGADTGAALIERVVAGEIEAAHDQIHLYLPEGHVCYTLQINSFTSFGRRLVAVMYLDETKQYEAEEDVRRSEQRFRSLVQNGSDVIALISADRMIQYMSCNAQRVTGTDPCQVEGTDAAELVLGPDRTRFCEVFDTLVEEGGETTLELRALGPEHRPIWLEMRMSNQLDNPAVDAVICNSRNITERKEHEAFVQERDALFREMADDTPAIIWLTDRERRIEYVSEMWRVFAGPDAKKATSVETFVRFFVHADDQETTRRSFDEAYTSRSTLQVTLRLQAASGHYRWMLLTGRPGGDQGGFIGSIVDIHDSHEARKLLAQQEARYRAFLDSISEGVYYVVLDAPMPLTLPLEEQCDFVYRHGRLVECNNHYAHQSGFGAASNMEGQLLSELFYLATPDVLDWLLLMAEEGYTVHQRQTTEKTDYGLRTFDNNIIGTFETHAGVRYLVSFMGCRQDITERIVSGRRMLEIASEERHRLGHHLHDTVSSRLVGVGMMARALRDLVSIVSPDIASLAEGVKTQIEEAMKEVRGLAHNYARVRIEREGFEQVLRGAVRTFQTYTTARITLVIDTTRLNELPPEDADNLYNIIIEAVTNAIKHAHPRRIAIKITEDKNVLATSVTDDGAGIPQECLRGLGLDLMEHRAAAMNARLIVRTADGTQVLCRYPLNPTTT